jgi:hypothetical protein
MYLTKEIKKSSHNTEKKQTLEKLKRKSLCSLIRISHLTEHLKKIVMITNRAFINC